MHREPAGAGGSPGPLGGPGSGAGDLGRDVESALGMDHLATVEPLGPGGRLESSAARVGSGLVAALGYASMALGAVNAAAAEDQAAQARGVDPIAAGIDAVVGRNRLRRPVRRRRRGRQHGALLRVAV